MCECVTRLCFCLLECFVVFVFDEPATSEAYPLSLHDALPIWTVVMWEALDRILDYKLPSISRQIAPSPVSAARPEDRKSTRLNSSHRCISYAVFCLKKKHFAMGVRVGCPSHGYYSPDAYYARQ